METGPNFAQPGRAPGGGGRHHQRRAPVGPGVLAVGGEGRGQVDARRPIGLVQPGHGPVDQDGAGVPGHGGQEALGLSQGVAEEHAGAARRPVSRPPVGHGRFFHPGGGPAVDGQAEGGLGDQGVAALGLEGGGGGVGAALVVAGDHPHLAPVFHPHLGRPQHVPRRVEGNVDPVEGSALAPVHGIQGRVGAEAGSEYPFPGPGHQVRPGPGPGVVGVGVGEHGPIHRTPRVDPESAHGAVEAVVGDLEEGRWNRGWRHAVPQREKRSLPLN